VTSPSVAADGDPLGDAADGSADETDGDADALGDVS
jgi:hypothetical protein